MLHWKNPPMNSDVEAGTSIAMEDESYDATTDANQEVDRMDSAATIPIQNNPEQANCGIICSTAH
eukprot:CAMPEP_0168760768 /NCGR_PEP_ID=MMETSP0724-20121128/22943_1 /TAXON_ID=265536 /ORGANISM="Amphiprora sp., Strain CCMP467" /LENGTH=64 /DNA_ID=CAMNT_0008809801 /DNA_START=309 /DNA_END=503 /DNA_ORIENTATION=-